MATVTFKGSPVRTVSSLPTVGAAAPEFTLVRSDLSEVTLQTYQGKKKVLNIFPSIDTGTCAMSVRRFNQEAANLTNVAVLNISADLPFAQSRFCGAEGIKNAETLSTFRSDFGRAYGLTFEESPLKGLLSRAVVTLDEDNRVLYTEQVAETGHEPNYERALNSLR